MRTIGSYERRLIIKLTFHDHVQPKLCENTCILQLIAIDIMINCMRNIDIRIYILHVHIQGHAGVRLHLIYITRANCKQFGADSRSYV
jgi:hypothetical protein